MLIRVLTTENKSQTLNPKQEFARAQIFSKCFDISAASARTCRSRTFFGVSDRTEAIEKTGNLDATIFFPSLFLMTSQKLL